MTAEVAFARTFLSVLDAKPIKVQQDYAADLRTLELSGSYTLPKYAKPMTQPDAAPSAAPGSELAPTVILKSLRNPPLDLTLRSQPPTTSVHDLKQRVAKELGLPGIDKIRLLYKKKPCLDSKSVQDLLGEGSSSTATVEFSVMVMGGIASSSQADKEDVQMKDTEGSVPVAPGEEAGAQVLSKPEFWIDLQGFLSQRIKDESVAEKATSIFRDGWKEKGEA